MSTRTYDSGVLLETGARNFVVSAKHEKTFGVEVERWRRAGWVAEVGQERRKGKMTEGTWFEGSKGGLTGLVTELVKEVVSLGGDRLKIHYDVTVSSCDLPAENVIPS